MRLHAGRPRNIRATELVTHRVPRDPGRGAYILGCKMMLQASAVSKLMCGNAKSRSETLAFVIIEHDVALCDVAACALGAFNGPCPTGPRRQVAVPPSAGRRAPMDIVAS